jgi:hypothetical protein
VLWLQLGFPDAEEHYLKAELRIDPFSDRIARECRLNRGREYAPVGEDAGPRTPIARAEMQLLFSCLVAVRSALLRAGARRQWMAITRIAAGPRMTMNSTGRKNTIIGTVSLGGNPAAFFSASDMRMSRFSWAMTRSVVPIGVP